MSKTGIKLIANNKKAYFDFFIDEKFECGISLAGTEVKSLRTGKCSIKESFVRIINNTRKKLNWHEEMVKAEADAKKKADEKVAADKAAAEAAAAAAQKAAIEAEYYANVKEQAALLREIKDILNKK